MVKKEALKGRIYKAEEDGSCINCGKKAKGLDKALEMTYVFEHCSLQKIIKEIRAYFKDAMYEAGVVKITITLVEN